MKTKVGLLCIFVLAVLNIYSWQEVFALSDTSLRISFLDVGQGDSVFLEAPGGYQVIIDGGPDSKALIHLSSMIPFFDRTLDLVVLTHPDADHLDGLLYVLEKYKANYILWTGVQKSTSDYERWLELLEKQKQKGAKVVIASPGLKIKAGGLLMEDIYPLESVEGQTISAVNETSIVAKAIFGNTSFLLTGDIGESSEQKIVESGSDIAADVLKVPHHGSKYSSSEIFLAAVNSGTAVISCGKDNRYGHPTQEALERLEKFNIAVLRTDEEGTVKIKSDGEQIWVRK